MQIKARKAKPRTQARSRGHFLLWIERITGDEQERPASATGGM